MAMGVEEEMSTRKTDSNEGVSGPERWLDDRFEKPFWTVRIISIAAVLLTFFVAVVWFAAIFVDGFHVLHAARDYVGIVDEESRKELIRTSVEAIDGVLMALLFMVFAYGIYELFIGQIDPRNDDDECVRGKILRIHDIDELKGKLAKLILMILIVKVFNKGLELQVTSFQELLQLTLVVMLVAVALFVTHLHVRIDYSNRGSADSSSDGKGERPESG